MKQADKEIIALLTDIKAGGGGGGETTPPIPLTALDTDPSPADPADDKVMSQKAVVDYVAANAGGGYKVYAARLLQLGTDAPVATVLQNTLGGTVVWSYSTNGTYAATLAGVFPAGKVPTSFGLLNTLYPVPLTYKIQRLDNDAVSLITYSEGVETDDALPVDFIIEIHVYP